MFDSEIYRLIYLGCGEVYISGFFGHMYQLSLAAQSQTPQTWNASEHGFAVIREISRFVLQELPPLSIETFWKEFKRPGSSVALEIKIEYGG